MVFQDVLWPDFDRRDLWRACLEYASRDRRFGGAEAVRGGEGRARPRRPPEVTSDVRRAPVRVRGPVYVRAAYCLLGGAVRAGAEDLHRVGDVHDSRARRRSPRPTSPPPGPRPRRPCRRRGRPGGGGGRRWSSGGRRTRRRWCAGRRPRRRRRGTGACGRRWSGPTESPRCLSMSCSSCALRNSSTSSSAAATAARCRVDRPRTGAAFVPLLGAVATGASSRRPSASGHCASPDRAPTSDAQTIPSPRDGPAGTSRVHSRRAAGRRAPGPRASRPAARPARSAR